MRGKFIVLEGEDDLTLNRIAEYIAAQLQSREVPVSVTRDPTTGPVGGQIHLARTGRLHLDAMTLAVLSVAERMDHLGRADGGIQAQLEAGQCVICQHYLLSAYAEQSKNIALEWLVQINQLCPWPDLVIVVERSMPSERRMYYQQAIAQCKASDREIITVDGEQSVETLLKMCYALVEQVVSE
jgi:dTMP kinase